MKRVVVWSKVKVAIATADDRSRWKGEMAAFANGQL